MPPPPKIYFPNIVWDGSSNTRTPSKHPYRRPDGDDYDQIVREVIATQEYVLALPSGGGGSADLSTTVLLAGRVGGQTITGPSASTQLTVQGTVGQSAATPIFRVRDSGASDLLMVDKNGVVTVPYVLQSGMNTGANAKLDSGTLAFYSASTALGLFQQTTTRLGGTTIGFDGTSGVQRPIYLGKLWGVELGTVYTTAPASTPLTVQGAALQTAALVTLRQVSGSGVEQDAAKIDAPWADSANATRKGRLTLSACDWQGDREGIRVQANGTVALLGFFGAAAVAQPSGDISAALVSLGLVTSPTTGPTIGGAVSGGTAGRVLFEGAGPVVADSANLTYVSSVLTVGGASNGISCPGTGNTSEHFGAGSSAAGDFSVALGKGCVASASTAIAIGNTTTVSHAQSLAIGYGASSSAVNQITFGANGYGYKQVIFIGDATGVSWVFMGLSTVTTNPRPMSHVDTAWADNTDATRKGRISLKACDASGTDKEGIRVESAGAAPAVGFFGVTAVAKPAVSGSRGANAALAALLTALASLGLITDSTSA